MRPLLKIIGIAAVLALTIAVFYRFDRTRRLEQEIERAKPHFERIAAVR